MIALDLYKQLETTEGTKKIQVQMTLESGDFVAVYGASGVGKTTLLRMIAGLSAADQGSIVVDGDCWYNSTTQQNKTAQERKVGFVFQDYALFPNMSVLDNLRFANPNASLIETLLEQTNLTALQHKKPTQLSGGQQQRVALARALVMQPMLLLLDEPLSALDNHLRVMMQQLIQTLHERYQMTTIMVSHDIPEIVQLANKILVLEGTTACLHQDPMAYFQAEQKLQYVQQKAVVQAIEGEKVVLKVGEESRTIWLSPKETTTISPQDEVVLKGWLFQPKIDKL